MSRESAYGTSTAKVAHAERLIDLLREFPHKQIVIGGNISRTRPILKPRLPDCKPNCKSSSFTSGEIDFPRLSNQKPAGLLVNRKNSIFLGILGPAPSFLCKASPLANI
jgi:hypothetical protein